MNRRLFRSCRFKSICLVSLDFQEPFIYCNTRKFLPYTFIVFGRAIKQ